MKGKKFEAAEKHFIEKENRYKDQIRKALATISSLNSNLEKEKTKNHELTMQNLQQEDWIERLLQYTELPLSDIKMICEFDKKRGALVNFVSMFIPSR